MEGIDYPGRVVTVVGVKIAVTKCSVYNGKSFIENTNTEGCL